MAFVVEGVCTSGYETKRLGESQTLNEAIEIAKLAIENFLIREFRKDMSADELYSKYIELGLVPCIFRDDGETMIVRNFNYMQYAKGCCAKICSGR